jgi:4-amino-4-deoxy-L-arabinose transferase-like glycosyltransferase
MKLLTTRPQYLLLAIVLLAAALRLWQIGSVPPSPDWDEAAYGYNAYSLMHTGRDEYGEFLPVVLRSFDDYKPALYLYLVIPFVSLLGVTTEAVRLPSAIAGIITVFLTYKLVMILFKREDIAILTAVLLAISPWHIQFSRVGFEANVGVLLNMCMVYFFLRGLKRPWFLIFAAICGGLSIYAYQSEKVFTPLLGLALVAVYWASIKKISLRFLLSAVIIGFVVISPILFYLVSNQHALTRAKETSIFADTANINRYDLRIQEDRNRNDSISKVFDNRRVFYVIKIIDGYLAHFSLKWLFITGDLNQRHHAPSMGLLYLFELPLLLFGIYRFIFHPFDRKSKLLVLLWFFIVPIPASITREVPHAVRTINFLPLFQLFTAVGIVSLFGYFLPYQRKSMKHKGMIFSLYTLFFLFASFNMLYYLNQYFVQMNYYTGKDWQYGYLQAISFVKAYENEYESIVVSDNSQFSESYIFFLYYLNYPPEKYQERTAKESHDFGKYTFRKIDWNKDKDTVKTLFVGSPNDFSEDKNVLQRIYYPDGTEAITLVGEHK